MSDDFRVLYENKAQPSGARLFRTETKEMKHNNNQNMNAQIIQIIEEAKEPYSNETERI